MADGSAHDGNSAAETAAAARVKPKDDPVGRHLVSCGYAVRLQTSAWTECLIAGHGEAWLGRGLDDAAAREDALRQMLPSSLARQAFAAAVVAEVAPVVVPFEPHYVHAHAPPAPSADQAPQELAAAVVDAGIPEPQAQVLADSDDTAQPGMPPPQSDDDVVVVRGTAPESVPVTSRHRRPTDPHAAIDEIVAEMEAARDDVALYAPDRLLLDMANWVCRARAVQDSTGDERIYNRVRFEVAGRMTRWAKQFWPGGLPALRLNSTPDQMAAYLGGAARRWEDAADLAEDRLAEAMWGDEYGWAEAEPGENATCPGTVLAAAKKLLDDILGLGTEPDSDEFRHNFHAITDQYEAHEHFVRAARMLRWIRTATPDPRTWGLCVGRLRWVARQASLQSADPLVLALDPQYVPLGGWAALLGFDARQGEERRRRDELLQTRPAPACDIDALAIWFRDAAGTFDADELAPLLVEHKALMLLMDPMGQFAGKALAQCRDRLRKVQKRLSGPQVLAPNPLLLQVELPELAALAAGAVLDDSPVARARTLVAGKRALVVSNRSDSHLERQFQEQLDITVEWCDANQRRVLDAACERVRNGAVDIVLALTGFMSHTDVAPLKAAAQASGAMYVRCYKGRLLATSCNILAAVGAGYA